MNLGQIDRQCSPSVVCQRHGFHAIGVEIDSHAYGCRRFGGRNRRGIQLEAQKVHRRSLFLILALQVLVGDSKHLRLVGHLHPHAILDALQLRQRHLALVRVGVLDHHGGLPVGAVRDQRVVGVELVHTPPHQHQPPPPPPPPPHQPPAPPHPPHHTPPHQPTHPPHQNLHQA